MKKLRLEIEWDGALNEATLRQRIEDDLAFLNKVGYGTVATVSRIDTVPELSELELQMQKTVEQMDSLVAAKDLVEKQWAGDRKAKDRAEREKLHAEYRLNWAHWRYDALMRAVENYRGPEGLEIELQSDGSRFVHVVDYRRLAKSLEAEVKLQEGLVEFFKGQCTKPEECGACLHLTGDVDETYPNSGEGRAFIICGCEDAPCFELEVPLEGFGCNYFDERPKEVEAGSG